MFLLKYFKLEWVNKILVSSAKIIGAEVLFIILGKSFIYNRKCRGPKIEPCGTPCLKLCVLKVVNKTTGWYEECIFYLISNYMFRPIHGHPQVWPNLLSFHYVNELWCGDLNISYVVSIGYMWKEGVRNQNYMLLWWRRGKISSWGSPGVVLLPWYVGPTVGDWGRISPNCGANV